MKYVIRAALALVLLPILAIAIVLAAANTAPGQRLIETEASKLTGGQVVLSGLSGRFPDALRLAHAELRDAKGPWLTLDRLVLNWSPTALLGRTAEIDLLTADALTLSRLPAPAPTTPAPKSTGPFSLPVQVDLHALHVARLALGAAVAGRAELLAIDGSADIVSLQQGRARLAIDNPGGGAYRLDATLTPAAIAAKLTATEPQGGLIGGLANLPGLGALGVVASIDGPRNAVHADIKISAGQLNAAATGTIDLVGQSAALDIDAAAPAMAPRPDLSWGGIAVGAHVHGPFTRPDITAHATLNDLKAGGATLAALTLDAAGNRGTLDAHAVLAGLVIPSAKPDLFASAPLDLTLHADLDKPGIPARFTLKHPLLMADGTAQASGNIGATIHTIVPDLQPLAAIGGVDLQGHADATASFANHDRITDIKLDGTADFAGGQAPVPTLLGPTRYGVTARLDGQDFTISRATVDGKAAHASVTGTDTPAGLDLAWTLALSDLAAASPQLKGALAATGHVGGPQTGIAVQAAIKGRIGTASIAAGPVSVTLDAQNLPSRPTGTVVAQGSFAGAPLALEASVDRAPDGSFNAVLKRAAWKSFAAEAKLVLPKGASIPTGTVVARMARLADLQGVLHQTIAGSFTAKLATTGAGRPDAKIDLVANGVSAAGAAIDRLALTGDIRDPAGKNADFNLALAADGIAAQSVNGTARITAQGPLSALRIRAGSALQADNAPAHFATEALLDLPQSRVTLQSLAADYSGENLRLAAPAHLRFGASTGVDRLRVALGTATLDIAGNVAPTLSLTASLRNVTPALAEKFVPGLHAAGVLTADAKLSGTTASPHGTLRLQATGLRLRSGPAASLPPASVAASVALQGDIATIDARADAGPRLHVAAAGTVPIKPGSAIALHATGGLDLALLNPVLNAGGRRATGAVALNANVAGTIAAPRIDGAITLARGEVQDFAQGVHITDIAARIAATGESVDIQSFSAKAGPGTLALTGSVGVLAPGLPVNLHFVAHDARPLASDLLTADLDADLSVQGDAAGTLQANGNIFVRKAEIDIPNALPPSVAVLNVRTPGYKPPPPAPASPPGTLLLDIVIDAPNNLFVRGHGLDSELGGKLTIGGSAAAPQIAGGFQMRRGDISVAGTTLEFSKGEVGFDGTSVTNKIDPTLDFVANSTSGSVTATLTVGGYADAPKITLSSVPDLPQDEVLAHLLFGESVKDLSAIQIAEIASALAELSGVTGGAGDPLAAVRKGLGLDRLSVGGGSGSGNGATVEAGRYVARGVYVGAKQATSGGGTAAIVQVDITKHLKATAQLATGGGSVQGATPDNDPGSTLGLSYGFDY